MEEIKELKKKENQEITDAIKDLGAKATPSLKGKLSYLSLLKEQLQSIQDNTVSGLSKALRNKYFMLYVEIFNKIGNIVKETSLSNLNSLISQEEKEKYNITIDNEENETCEPINNFWHDALENSYFFKINKKDKKIIGFLSDIKIETDPDITFITITFFFDQNEYFTNNKISKKYYIDVIKERVIKTECDKIEWKADDLNPCFKKKVKKGTNKEKLFEVDSFFDMFDEKKCELDEADSELEFIKESFIPCILEFVLNFKDDSDDDEGN